MKETRLSLVAQFDDIVRNSSILTTGIETEFWRFAQAQEDNRKRCAEAIAEASKSQAKIKSLEDENAKLQTKLKHANRQIDVEMKKRSKAESERDTLERQILIVRELLMDRNNQSVLNERDRERLGFLSTDFPSQMQSPRARKDAGLSVIEESMSLLSDDDISYDKTGEDLDSSALRSGRKYKRPSAPPMDDDEEDMTPPDKRHRAERADRSQERKQRKHRRSKSATVTTTTVTVTKGDDGFDATAEISTSKPGKHTRTHSGGKLKKHHSAKDISELNKENHGTEESYRGTPTIHGGILGTQNRTPDSPRLRSYNSAGKGLNRPHIFVSKTVIRPETCGPCGKRIRFGKEAMKCKDCRATAHRECKDQVPLPCIPATVTPGTAKSAQAYLADYAPTDPPMIPALVIHCVNEVEARGLSESGVYRVPGSEREVKELKEKFLRGKGTPNLTNVDDIYVVCGCLKDFLRNLKEPIITHDLWENFYNAAAISDQDESISNLYQAISRLPRANRDTLAFMILHLQRVSESPECKMGVSNLSKVFGPTLIGFSTANPEPMQILSETPKQAKVMERLMAITADYWTNFIIIDTEELHPMETMTPQTPEARPPPHSMLGPVSTPGTGGQGHHDQSDRKFWNTPRFGSKSRQMNKKPGHFFNSPGLN